MGWRWRCAGRVEVSRRTSSSILIPRLFVYYPDLHFVLGPGGSFIRDFTFSTLCSVYSPTTKMHTTNFLPLLTTLLITQTSAHGVVTLIRGANGVEMPGLSGTS